MTRQTQYIIDLPLKIIYNKKGDKFYINLNAYRNTHFQTLNKVKVLFEEQVSPKLVNLPKIKKLSITYILFIGSKHKADVSNICSIADKFFCDTLTNKNIIPDDNYEFLQDINYKWGAVDKENPRVEAHINIIEFEEEEPMRVTLVQIEIEEALTNYVRTHMPALNGVPKIELKAGRGEEGFTAEVNFQLGAATAASNGTVVASSTVMETGPITSSQTEEPPFLPDSTTAVAIENKAQEVTQEAIAEQAASESVIVSTPVTEAPTGVSTPKSLFANLSKPHHDPQ